MQDFTKSLTHAVANLPARYADPRMGITCYGSWDKDDGGCAGCPVGEVCKVFTQDAPSMQRRVFEKGKDKWPTLHKEDQRSLKNVAKHQLVGGQPYPRSTFDEWRVPHVRSDTGLTCSGRPGAEDVCERAGCTYSGTSIGGIERAEGVRAVKLCFEGQQIERPCVGCPGEEMCCFGKKYEGGDIDCEPCKWKEDCRSAMAAASEESEPGLPGKESAAQHNHCLTFEPKRICAVVMHERSRPSDGCIKEMGWVAGHVALEEHWQKLADEKLKEFKLKQTSLPYCHEHEGRWGLKGNKEVHVSLKAVLVKMSNNKGHTVKWARELWWVCPGEPDDWDGRDPPAGFGG
jgi:hypothetical protein